MVRGSAAVLAIVVASACAAGEDLVGGRGGGAPAADAGGRDVAAGAAGAGGSAAAAAGGASGSTAGSSAAGVGGGVAGTGGSVGGASGADGGGAAARGGAGGMTDAAAGASGASGVGAGGSAGASATGGASGTTGAGGSAGTGGSAARCPAGEFMTGFTSSGGIVCAPIDTAARDAIDTRCFVYLGWRDGCGACSSPPAKWGRVNGSSCTNGLGADDTCSVSTLGAESVQLFGLNTDGDVDSNDKFHLSLHCQTVTPVPVPGPCRSGEFVVSVTGSTVQCLAAESMAADTIGANCSTFLGWRDSCDGCSLSPARWGRANDASCSNPMGGNDTCSSAVLGTETVNLYGLSTSGDVNDDDKFYVGLHCTPPPPAGGPATTACPAGQLVVGVEADGTLACESPGPAIERFFETACTLYFGWRDSCGACATDPAKWGSVSHSACANGVGSNSTCTIEALGGETVQLFGLNTDGDVGNDDKFYVGFDCR